MLGAVFSVIRAADVATQHGKQIYAATNPDATMKELLEALFSARSAPNGYQRDKFRS
jgi:hypothetical protein